MKRLILSALLLPTLAFSEGIIPPEVDPLATILALFQNWAAMSPLVLGSTLIALTVQLLKMFVGDFEYKRIVIAGLGVVYGVITALLGGYSVFDALVAALITSGGAVAMYEAIKPLLPKVG